MIMASCTTPLTKMEFFNKKSVIFLLVITFLICSSYASRLPQDRVEDGELVGVDGLGDVAKGLVNKIKQLFGGANTGPKKVFKIGVKTGKAYNTVTGKCLSQFKCSRPRELPGHVTCGAYCVYTFVASSGNFAQCQQTCKPNLNCTYQNGSIKCSP
ncbi:uncharacterized protein LOC111883965 [Lactuca sativa]|uniref:Uncharacterized protein n=1 Tax=Lactuca sativa TaxID=4236 RepID=A0A9R1UFS6_LACSA|nr:uncharacterized protein LOC111883965 [Lactuca sativa]KAJ0186361.1 hypothetical protein LSAT_V11C900505260 [Lactuca sativa]